MLHVTNNTNTSNLRNFIQQKHDKLDFKNATNRIPVKVVTRHYSLIDGLNLTGLE